MGVVKYQHYVPQAYLRGFAHDDEKIYVYYNQKDICSLSRIEDVGGENYIYDYKLSELKSFVKQIGYKDNFDGITQSTLSGNQPIEHFFADWIEGRLFDSIKQVINLFESGNVSYGKPVFDDAIKYEWSLYCMYQFHRTPSFKKNMDRMLIDGSTQMRAIVEQFARTRNIDLNDKIKEIDDSIHPYSLTKGHLNIITNAKHIVGMANIHWGMYKWVIMVAEGNTKFVTTDNPGTFSNRYLNANSTLYFPINHSLCFALYSKFSKEYETHIDCSFIKAPEDVVDIVNSEIIQHSERIIFSNHYVSGKHLYAKGGFLKTKIYETYINDFDNWVAVKMNKYQSFPSNLVSELQMNGFTQIGYYKEFPCPIIYVNLNKGLYKCDVYGSLMRCIIEKGFVEENEFAKTLQHILKY